MNALPDFDTKDEPIPVFVYDEAAHAMIGRGVEGLRALACILADLDESSFGAIVAALADDIDMAHSSGKLELIEP